MNKAGMVFGFLIIMVAFILLPTLLNAFDAWDYTESTTTSAITTDAGETSGNVTLGYDLYNANLDNVIDISSSSSSDTPAPASYNEVSQILTIDGLAEDTTRSVTIEYRTARDDDFLSSISTIMPFLIVVFLIILGAGLAYMSWRRG